MSKKFLALSLAGIILNSIFARFDPPPTEGQKKQEPDGKTRIFHNGTWWPEDCSNPSEGSTRYKYGREENYIQANNRWVSNEEYKKFLETRRQIKAERDADLDKKALEKMNRGY